MWAVAASAAETWVVPDDGRAEEVRAALAVEWPGAELVVAVGAAPPQDGPFWDGLELVWTTAGDVRRAPADTASAAVLLARTWSIEPAALPPEEWVLPPLPPAPAPPPPPPPPPEPRVASPWSYALGVGARLSPVAPSSGARVVGGVVREAWPWVGFTADAMVGAGVATGRQVDALIGRRERGYADLALAGAEIGARLGPRRAGLRLGIGAEGRWVLAVLRTPDGGTSADEGPRTSGVASAAGDVRVGRFGPRGGSAPLAPPEIDASRARGFAVELVVGGYGRFSAGEGDAGVTTDVRWVF